MDELGHCQGMSGYRTHNCTILLRKARELTVLRFIVKKADIFFHLIQEAMKMDATVAPKDLNSSYV